MYAVALYMNTTTTTTETAVAWALHPANNISNFRQFVT